MRRAGLRSGVRVHEDAQRWFTRFHGRAPEWVSQPIARPAWLADVGDVVAVTYRARGRAGLREHVFSPGAGPTIARDETGAGHLVGGAYKITEQGIMDQSRAMMRDGRAGLMDARARYTPGGVPVHGRQVPAEGVMVPRANPITMDDLRARAPRVGHALVMGGVASVAVGVTDAVVERMNWSEGYRAFVQGAVNVGVGGVLVLTDTHDDIGSGLIAAGVVAPVLRMARARQWDRMVAGWLARLRGVASASPSGAGVIYDDGDFKVESRVSA